MPGGVPRREGEPTGSALCAESPPPAADGVAQWLRDGAGSPSEGMKTPDSGKGVLRGAPATRLERHLPSRACVRGEVCCLSAPGRRTREGWGAGRGPRGSPPPEGSVSRRALQRAQRHTRRVGSAVQDRGLRQTEPVPGVFERTGCALPGAWDMLLLCRVCVSPGCM